MVVIDKKVFMDSIFSFFDLIIKYYKHLKKIGKFSFKVPSQVVIGAAFGGLANNYAFYKKDKRLPDLWNQNTSDAFIINDIYDIQYIKFRIIVGITPGNSQHGPGSINSAVPHLIGHIMRIFICRIMPAIAC